MFFRHALRMVLFVVLACSCLTTGRAADTDAKAIQQAVQRAAAFLQTKAMTPDGSYAPQSGPGVTAVVVAGLLRNGLSPADPAVAPSLKYLEGMVQPDGGICGKNSPYRNYETCLGVLCFSEANRDGRYTATLKKAEAFLKQEQWGENRQIDKANPQYGGAGYGKHERPDLSNTQFLVDALKQMGAGPDDEAMKKALIFISRCQNLESEHNTTGLPTKNPDGGFYYTSASSGVSMAGKTDEGGLRSYGSMTYAGLKSMIYAGVSREDPRVRAAFAWIQKHYDLKSNPNMGQAGLYYYYHTFAKALDAMKIDTLEDAQGVKHPWRSELAAELLARQNADGSWANPEKRWLEGEPSLVTGYVLLTLSYCYDPTGKK